MLYLTPGESEDAIRAIEAARDHFHLALKPFKGANRETLTTEALDYIAKQSRAIAHLERLRVIIEEAKS